MNHYPLWLDSFAFRPYSLRRGGATWWFPKHQNLDRILVQGRWSALKTARIYLNEGLAMLARTQIDFKHPRILSYLKIYHQSVQSLNFSTLEPSVKKTDRAGGRGRQASKRKAMKTVKKQAMKKGAFSHRYTYSFSLVQATQGFGHVCPVKEKSLTLHLGFGQVTAVNFSEDWGCRLPLNVLSQLFIISDKVAAKWEPKNVHHLCKSVLGCKDG